MAFIWIKYGFYMFFFNIMAFIWLIWLLDIASEDARVCEEFGCQRVHKNMWICAVPSGRMQI
jgi:hypothetical protein